MSRRTSRPTPITLNPHAATRTPIFCARAHSSSRMSQKTSRERGTTFDPLLLIQNPDFAPPATPMRTHCT